MLAPAANGRQPHGAVSAPDTGPLDQDAVRARSKAQMAARQFLDIVEVGTPRLTGATEERELFRVIAVALDCPVPPDVAAAVAK